MARFALSTLAVYVCLALTATALPMNDNPGNTVGNAAAADTAKGALMDAAEMMDVMKASENQNQQNGLNFPQTNDKDTKEPTPSKEDDMAKKNSEMESSKETKNKMAQTPQTPSGTTPQASPAAASTSASPTPQGTHKTDSPLAGLPVVGGLLSGGGLI
ncbi:hypothetical protein ASPWEDRAFT_23332 [Aspergillus wentii DTO 134E9]|uniref:Uncharacterized protein n=1 Tax=Aspergillus wentii DTO 134E9 TaxID=1073089 RepID=A0A1L9S252_ASPWE|nr:uncharacterized protein ASPWEDRAFT_23332 [Aspergillus wentii DTO 134E9]KAI9923998.1 hypothetical protein MW887_007456 [Aspergillus wentii]OJJ41225.1 hypothetical protein ASPWEDRAFT_23332 [Aspergillus wentii DTO 134E9]